MSIKTIFLDRDGVINKDINYLHKIEDFEFISGVFETCRYLQHLDYQIIIITNQSGISRGYYTEKDFQTITEWMLAQFKKNDINILDVFHCPHSPDSHCNCRKPKPGMLLNAKHKHNINMQNSWIIGDKEADIIAGISSGITNTILVKSGHKIDELNSKAKFIIDSIQQTNKIITS
jgi:D-glycero-D-manno-heptose 1,7-bisphosphate phosphatase